MTRLNSNAIAILLGYIFGASQGQILDIKPENKAPMLNEDVLLECRVSQPDSLTTYVSWSECITNNVTCVKISEDSTIVYSGDATTRARYGIDSPSRKQHNLKISGVQYGDGGKYRCHPINNPSENRDAEVIVVDNAPECDGPTGEMAENKEARFTCRAEYRGRWPPRFNWKLNGAPYGGLINTYDGVNEVYEFIDFEVNMGNNGDVYEMTMSFDSPTGLIEKEATNVPVFGGYTYTFVALTVVAAVGGSTAGCCSYYE